MRRRRLSGRFAFCECVESIAKSSNRFIRTFFSSRPFQFSPLYVMQSSSNLHRTEMSIPRENLRVVGGLADDSAHQGVENPAASAGGVDTNQTEEPRTDVT